jgi:beta-fructofuranosidase
LRRDPLQLTPAEPIPAAAFDVELPAGRTELCLVDGADEELVAEIDVATPAVVSPRILVDGSIVEVVDGLATPYTTRAYPTGTSRWLLRPDHPAAMRAWHLGL